MPVGLLPRVMFPKYDAARATDRAPWAPIESGLSLRLARFDTSRQPRYESQACHPPQCRSYAVCLPIRFGKEARRLFRLADEKKREIWHEGYVCSAINSPPLKEAM